MRTYIARAYERAKVRSLPVVRPAPRAIKPVRVEALNDFYATEKAWKLLRKANPKVLKKAKRKDWIVFVHAVHVLDQVTQHSPRVYDFRTRDSVEVRLNPDSPVLAVQP